MGNKSIGTLGLAILLCFYLAACRHPLAIEGMGDIVAPFTERDCTKEQADAGQCEFEITGHYNDIYFSKPHVRWKASHWETCDFEGTSEAGHPFLMRSEYNSCYIDVSAEFIESVAGVTSGTTTAHFELDPNVFPDYVMGENLGLSIFWDPAHKGKANLLDFANAKRLHDGGCNASRWNNTPRLGNVFIGRHHKYAIGTECLDEPVYWRLTHGTMDNSGFSTQGDLVDLPLSLNDGEYGIISAYDPSVFEFDKEVWIAFECHAPRTADPDSGFTHSGVGICMGPLGENYRLDRDRTYLVVKDGGYEQGDLHAKSATVPKLVRHQGKPYLYWTVVHKLKSNPDPWSHITGRGIELEQETGNLRRLWPKGIGEEITADDARASTVWDILPADPRSDTVADIFNIYSDGDYLYAVASLGGSGCINSSSQVDGCYRMAMARSTQPLGENIFHVDQLPESDLVSSPGGYFNFYLDETGKLMMIHKNYYALTTDGQRVAITEPSEEFTLDPRSTLSGVMRHEIAVPETDVCFSVTHPATQFGVKNGVCLPSCEALDGTGYQRRCEDLGLTDTGMSHDEMYCCI